MNTFLEKLNYGNMIVDANNIHVLWLLGESGINQLSKLFFFIVFIIRNYR
jgi:hypothetical protein